MNKEENILLQYQVRSKTTMGTRYYYFYAKTDIENYLNSKNIKYVRYAKDTALNRQQKRILETKDKEKFDLVEYKDYKILEKENQQLKEQLKQKEALIKKIENIFDDTNNSFSDGCDCRKIEKLLDNKGE